MLFRHLLSQNYTTGNRGKNISQRSLKLIDTKLKPVLIVDCTYIAYLLESRHYSKVSRLQGTLTTETLELLRSDAKKSYANQKTIYDIRDTVLTLIKNTCNLVLPTKVVFVYGSTENLLTTSVSEDIVREILNPLGQESVVLTGVRYADFIFKFLQDTSTKLQDSLLVYVTNSITTWACCSHALKHGLIAFTRNLRPIFYTDKTGLDIICKFINTSKIINKLGLDDIKYVNLQYLYLLMLYIKFMHHKSDKIGKEKYSNFFFDAKYFKQEKRVEYDKFLRSNGSGLEMIRMAHKTISYIFLTKRDMVDQFLFFTTHNFILNLNQLAKLTEFDRTLMSYLSNYYMLSDRLSDASSSCISTYLYIYNPSEFQQVTSNKSLVNCEPLLLYRQTKGKTKADILPLAYAEVITALNRGTSGEKIYFQKSFSPLAAPPHTDMNTCDEAIAKILRSLQW